MDAVRRAPLDEQRTRRRGRAPAPEPAPLPAEQLLWLQRSAGNAAVARALAARTFDRAAYQRSMDERANFMAWVYESISWRPSTGRGNFDVLYEPKTGALTVTVKCKFWFAEGKASAWPDAEPEELQWTPDAILKWKADFLRKVSNFWSGHFTFHCTRDWWEDLQAAVQVRFVETGEKDAHYELDVTKIPEGEFKTSTTYAPKPYKMQGHAKLNSEDLLPHDTRHGDQTGAYHESGHMLGLGDEYPKKGAKGVAHEKLVNAEFGHGVPRHKDGRLMSYGDTIVPDYGVTFLEALRVITDLKEWSFTAKPPAPVLSEPVDGPDPVKQSPVAPRPPQVAVA